MVEQHHDYNFEKTKHISKILLKYAFIIFCIIVVIGAGIEVYEYYYKKSHYNEMGHEIRHQFLEQHCKKIHTSDGHITYQCPNGKQYVE